MPSKSLAFARIRAEVKAAVCAVPRGRVTTYGAVAAHLEIVPRHVAFVLASLKGAESETIPWHRVVAEGGELRSSSEEGLSCQRRRLAAEKVTVSRGRVIDFARLVYRWPRREDGPGRAVRSAYSDPTTPPLFPESIRFGYPLVPLNGGSSGSAPRPEFPGESESSKSRPTPRTRRER